MAVALFFFSCEDENSFVGLKNPVPKFNVSYVEIPLTSNYQLIDGIVSDNKPQLSLTNSGGLGNLLIGKYSDDIFGEVVAQPYLQIYPNAATQIPSSAQLDSITLTLRFNFYGYGFEGERTHKFAIHELLDSMDRRSSTRYYFNSDGIAMNPIAIGTSSLTVRADSLRKQLALEAARQDTLTARARLSRDLGDKIFALLKTYDFQSNTTTSAAAQVREFLSVIKGITLVPEGTTGILGFRIFNNFSAITLHYRTFENSAVKDTLTRSLTFNTPSFTKIDAARSNGILANLNADLSTGGTRYIQSGNPLVTKLDLQGFYSFADTVGNVLVNEASLVIDGVETPLNTPPIGGLALKVMRADSKFMDYNSVETDRAAMTPYALSSTNANGVLLLDANHYLIKSDAPTNPPQVGTLRYSDGQYSGYLTLFLQQLLKYRNDADGINDLRLRYLALYPYSPAISSSVSRTAFPASNVKLRITYTKPTLTVNP